MIQLARAIDGIDEALAHKGVIAVKAPDVWGQNRMTKYRAEFEEVMAGRKDGFQPLLQGAERRTDVAALTNAMAISATATPPPARRGILPGSRRPAAAPANPALAGALLQPQGHSVNVNNNNTPSGGSSANGGSAKSDSSSGGDKSGSGATPPELDDIAKRIDKMQESVLKLPDKIVNFTTKPGETGISLEPVTVLQEQARYLDALHQIRRKSAGDDLTDLPGYGLYLIRVPVSILPGKASRTGKGAVVTLEVKHELTDDLLENTVRDTLIKDIVYNLKEPVLWAIQNGFTAESEAQLLVKKYGGSTPDETLDGAAHEWSMTLLKKQADRITIQSKQKRELADAETKLRTALRAAETTAARPRAGRGRVSSGAGPDGVRTAGFGALQDAPPPDRPEPAPEDAPAPEKPKLAPMAPAPAGEGEKKPIAPVRTTATADKTTADETETDTAAGKPPGSFPGSPPIGYGVSGPSPAGEVSSQLAQILGPTFLAILSDAIKQSLNGDEWHQDSSVFSYLNSELQNAYRYMRQAVFEAERANALAQPDCGLASLFQPEEIERIAAPLLCRDYITLVRVRNEFLARLLFRKNPFPYFDEARYMSRLEKDKEYRIMIDTILHERIRAAEILCYMIVVQSIYIDRQIKQDMRVMHERRGFPYGGVADRSPIDSPQCLGLRFYDFRPTPEAKQLFKEYVRCKWPIHVYALDPEVDQQNILEAYSQRTELQLALSVALAAGKVSFSDAAKYARQLDLDLTTVGLNRTAIGFGGGRSTFGWKFYPRVQPPPNPSNPARIVGTLLYGGTKPDYDLIHRRIEPGARECVALMVVPNFVPAVHMSSNSNWFGLGVHGSEKLDTEDALSMSRKLQYARETLACTEDEGRYRPGELTRMSDRIEQLDNLMPTQDFRVDLPDEGDFSGSEIFSSDAANLSPSLLTWFGEPPSVGKSSDVFLLGKGFSVVESRVIAGGLDVPSGDRDLISRNVVRIKISKDAVPIRVKGKDKRERPYYDIHLATPNGISDYHLMIPAFEPKKPAEPKFGYTVETAKLDITLEYWLAPIAGAAAGTAPALQYVHGYVSPDAKVKLSLKETTGAVPPAIAPTFPFPKLQKLAASPFRPACAIEFDPDENGYVLRTPELNLLAYHVAMLVYGSGIDPRNPPASFKTIKITPVKIRPFLGGRWGAEVDSAKELTINVTFQLGPPPLTAPGSHIHGGHAAPNPPGHAPPSPFPPPVGTAPPPFPPHANARAHAVVPPRGVAPSPPTTTPLPPATGSPGAR